MSDQSGSAGVVHRCSEGHVLSRETFEWANAERRRLQAHVDAMRELVEAVNAEYNHDVRDCAWSAWRQHTGTEAFRLGRVAACDAWHFREAEVASLQAQVATMCAAIETYLENDSQANWDRLADIVLDDRRAHDRPA